MKRKIMEQRIWDYIDGNASESESAEIARLLTEDPAWQIKYAELMNLHALLQKEELDMPSLRFTKNVMEEISRLQVAQSAKNYISKKVTRGIAAFFLTLIGGLFIFFIAQISWTNNSSDSILPPFSLNPGTLNWSKLLSNSYVNIFVGINTILGLILIDKYMQGRKNSGHTRHFSGKDSA
jgi:hypothetical protein